MLHYKELLGPLSVNVKSTTVLKSDHATTSISLIAAPAPDKTVSLSLLSTLYSLYAMIWVAHTYTQQHTRVPVETTSAHKQTAATVPCIQSQTFLTVCVHAGGWDGWWCAVTAAGAERKRRSLYFYIYFYYFVLLFSSFLFLFSPHPMDGIHRKKGLLLSVFGVVTLGRWRLTPPTHLHLSSHDSASFRLTPPPIRLDNSALILFPYWMRRFPTHTHTSVVFPDLFLLPPQCGSHHLWIFFLVFTGNNNNSSWCASNNPAHWQNSDTNPMKFLFLFWNWTWKNIGHELIWNNDK
jgi:hypothetical protein